MNDRELDELQGRLDAAAKTPYPRVLEITDAAAAIRDLHERLADKERRLAQVEHKTVWVVSTKTFIQILDTEESAINFERSLGMDTGSLFVQPMEIPILHCDDPRALAPEQPAPMTDQQAAEARETTAPGGDTNVQRDSYEIPKFLWRS